ncbi:unnamed protein product (macronuclear) [Paramecium tetraurelia]|uniref:Uncharacterized protein n=1 Tax=Paramecium tetraurelia TaxID=5888 RepID=A0CPY3_PARTE|nr:uncharacterized protein GSPATT00038807001 [Paramecium tetraurelia]CAK72850.1 unnamed protein product [Paramecium tetraurelia]|eukprot:XP_001440247.1 hypothetical protein (macronuclear) [Paramecium tetraurelia strain d4-2]
MSNSQSVQNSFEEFEEVDYFDIENYQYISQLTKMEEEFEKEQLFINRLELKLKLMIPFLLEQLNKDNLRQCISNLSKIIKNKQLNDQYVKAISNIKTQYHRLTLKQCKQEIAQIILWLLFEIENS